MSALVTAGAALLGVAIGGVIQFFLNRQLFREQARREDVLHRRQMATLRHDQLKTKYERLLLAAQRLNEGFVEVFKAFIADEEGWNATATSAREDEFGVAGALLEIEAGTEHVIDLAYRYRRLMIQDLMKLVHTSGQSDPGADVEAAEQMLDETRAAYSELTKAIIGRLRALEALAEK